MLLQMVDLRLAVLEDKYFFSQGISPSSVFIGVHGSGPFCKQAFVLRKTLLEPEASQVLGLGYNVPFYGMEFFLCGQVTP